MGALGDLAEGPAEWRGLGPLQEGHWALWVRLWAEILDQVRSSVFPSARQSQGPLSHCLLAGPTGLAGVPRCTKGYIFLLLVLNLSLGQDPPTLVEEGAGYGGGGWRAAGLGTGPSSAPEWVWEPGKAS